MWIRALFIARLLRRERESIPIPIDGRKNQFSMQRSVSRSHLLKQASLRFFMVSQRKMK